MARKDLYADFQMGLSSPVAHGAAVTPDDTDDLEWVTRCLMVGQSGDVTCDLLGGETITFTSLQPGSLYPFRVKRVYATGTTASNIVGLW